MKHLAVRFVLAQLGRPDSLEFRIAPVLMRHGLESSELWLAKLLS